MHLITRKKGSQRESAPVHLTFDINWAGQGGLPYITMFDPNTERYYFLHFADIEEGRQMLSQAHIMWGNLCDEEAMQDFRKARGIGKPTDG